MVTTYLAHLTQHDTLGHFGLGGTSDHLVQQIGGYALNVEMIANPGELTAGIGLEVFVS